MAAGPQRPSEAANSPATQSATATYINTERVSYDGDTPLLIQMLPEISNASEHVKNGKMRDLLAVARGYATGIRANSSTTGAALWAELLAKDAQSAFIDIIIARTTAALCPFFLSVGYIFRSPLSVHRSACPSWLYAPARPPAPPGRRGGCSILSYRVITLDTYPAAVLPSR